MNEAADLTAGECRVVDIRIGMPRLNSGEKRSFRARGRASVGG